MVGPALSWESTGRLTGWKSSHGPQGWGRSGEADRTEVIPRGYIYGGSFEGGPNPSQFDSTIEF